MNYRIVAATFDSDTQRVLDIAVTFLSWYFGHSRSDAESLIAATLTTYTYMFDEDGIHHFGPYYLAASAHYLCVTKGDPQRLIDWMIDSGHWHTPYEALEYFNRTYFTADNRGSKQERD